MGIIEDRLKLLEAPLERGPHDWKRCAGVGSGSGGSECKRCGSWTMTPERQPDGCQATCVCGRALPMHLVDLMQPKDSHICSCERRYTSNGSRFDLAGTAANPFARYDAQELEQDSPAPENWASDARFSRR